MCPPQPGPNPIPNKFPINTAAPALVRPLPPLVPPLPTMPCVCCAHRSGRRRTGRCGRWPTGRWRDLARPDLPAPVCPPQAFQAGTPGNEFWVIHVYGTAYEVPPPWLPSPTRARADVDVAFVPLFSCARVCPQMGFAHGTLMLEEARGLVNDVWAYFEQQVGVRVPTVGMVVLVCLGGFPPPSALPLFPFAFTCVCAGVSAVWLRAPGSCWCCCIRIRRF